MITDRIGQELYIGDRVRTIQGRYSDVRGTDAGTVVHFDMPGNVGVSWEGLECGHDCNGHCAGGTGYYISSRHVEKVLEEETPVEQEGDSSTKIFEDLIAANPNILIIGNKIYKATMHGDAEVSKLFALRDNHVVEQYRKLREVTRQREEELRQQLEVTNLMPVLSLSQVVEHKIRLYGGNGALGFILPFEYRPRYIETSYSRAELKAEHQRRLKTDCLLDIQFSRAQVRHWVLRRDTATLGLFVHYHLHGSHDCSGDVHTEGVRPTVESVLAFRDRYQGVLEVINGSSLGTTNPRGLFHYETLTRGATPVESTGAWDVPRPAPRTTTVTVTTDRPTTGGVPEVGRLVRVQNVEDGRPEAFVGAVGRVVGIFSIEPINTRSIVKVEFAFTSRQLHNSGGAGRRDQCFNFRARSVQQMLLGSRRTPRPRGVE